MRFDVFGRSESVVSLKANCIDRIVGREYATTTLFEPLGLFCWDATRLPIEIRDARSVHPMGPGIRSGPPTGNR